jgi:hypothetical protein
MSHSTDFAGTLEYGEVNVPSALGPGTINLKMI